MTIVPPVPGAEPRGVAVPLAGMSPRRRPDGLVGTAANCPELAPPPELPEVDVEPPEEGAGAGAEEVAVPLDGVLPAWCWANATAGTASAPIRIAKVSHRVIYTDPLRAS